MKMLAILVLLVIVSTLFIGCLDSVTGEITGRKQKCRDNYDNCIEKCNDAGYWLDSDRTACKNRCKDSFDVCSS
ncbi:hypothetical protein K8R43_06370 [archaeon]|nr:hypothetical protein [archaeon]